MLTVRVRRAEVMRRRLRQLGRVGGSIATLVMTLAAIVWGYQRGRDLWLMRDSSFAVREVVVRVDGQLRAEQVRRTAGIETGMSLITIDLDAARRRLEAVPEVRAARLKRVLPDQIRIEVEERVPIAAVGWDNRHVVDRDGIVMAKRSESRSLPVLDGVPTANLKPGQSIPADAARFLSTLFDLMSAMGVDRLVGVECLALDDPDYARLYTTDGTAVTLSRAEPIDMQLARLAAVLTDVRRRGERVSRADVSLVPICAVPVPIGRRAL